VKKLQEKRKLKVGGDDAEGEGEAEEDGEEDVEAEDESTTT